jgi:hypothetical protein
MPLTPAPFHERHSIGIRGCRDVALSQIFKHQVGAAVRDSVKHGRLFVSGHLVPSRHDSLGPTSGILRPPRYDRFGRCAPVLTMWSGPTPR